MAPRHSTGEAATDTLDAASDKQRDLQTIDGLIDACRDRLSGVSSALISSATRASMIDMWRTLRDDAERDDLRAERLQWAQGAMAFLNDNVDKAESEREKFKADLDAAVEKKWIRAESKGEWMEKFEDPNLLEMRRSSWIRNEWSGYKARWATLAKDRAETLARVDAAGLTGKDVPEVDVLKNDAAFLSKERSYHTRRRLVDTVDAAITAAKTGKTSLLRTTEASLMTISTGPDRCMHPSKVGQWLKRMMNSSDPQGFAKDVLNPFFRNWKRARAAYDEIVHDYDAQEKPDGCMPMPLDAFLQLPYDTRLAVLAEARNRLTAAKNMESAENDELSAELRDIRRSVDLKDLDAADVRLAGLRIEHPDHPDVRSITDHIAALRAERENNDEPQRTESERTEEALASLRDMQEKLPTSVAPLFQRLIDDGDAEQAALVFASMKVHADRVRSGQLSKEDAAEAALEAEEAEEATIVERTPAPGDALDDNDASLLVSAGTPPATTLAMLKERGARDPKRFPGLVFDLPADQHLQLVALNERTLADMRHLSTVGKPYGAKESQSEALAS